MKTHTNHIMFAACVLAVVTSCTNVTNNHSDIPLEDTIEKNSIDVEVKKANDLFTSLPSSHEIVTILINHPDTKYDETLLNKISNSPNYNTSLSRAVNIGIYGTDMCYASLFEQNQAVLNYVATIKDMSEQIGILQIFDDATLNRMQANVDDKDSMINIITSTFYKSDEYLVKNGQHEIAALIISGAWIEGVYAAFYLSKGDINYNPRLSSRLLAQCSKIGLMIDYLTQYADDKFVSSVYSDYLELHSIIISSDIKIVDNNYTCSSERFKIICDKVLEIRAKYVSL